AGNQGAPRGADRTGGDSHRRFRKIPPDRQGAIGWLVDFPRLSRGPAPLSGLPARRPPMALLFSGRVAPSPSRPWRPPPQLNPTDSSPVPCAPVSGGIFSLAEESRSRPRVHRATIDDGSAALPALS